MIRKKMVLVLGAGASAEAKFPTGPDLKKKIADGVRFRFEPLKKVSGDDFLFEVLQRRFSEQGQVNRELLNKHLTAGNKLSEIIASFVSIDEALHWYSSDTALVSLGKLAVARFILEAEQSCKLRKLDENTGNPTVAKLDGTWLPQFFSLVIGAGKHEDAENIFENLTIVNFNYDRCVEQYLYMALQERAGVAADVAKAALGKLKVIRPYGSLGELDWQDEKSGLRFGGSANGVSLFGIADRIRTYTEQLHTQIENDINFALRYSHLTMILGFGFHPQNMALLTKALPSADGVARIILGSVYKIDRENHSAIENELVEHLGGRPHTTIKLLDRTSFQIFDQLRPVINMAVN